MEMLIQQKHQLQQELKELKEVKSRGGTSSWSEVTPVEPQTPVNSGQQVQSRFTPGGTKVPDDTPPRSGWNADGLMEDCGPPPPPPQLPEFPDPSMYELTHDKSGYRGKTMGSWQWVLSTEAVPQPPIWPTPAEEIREAARLLNARTREREAAHQGRAFDGHGGLPHQDRAWHLHGAGAHQDRAVHPHGAGAHQDRAWHLHGAGAHQDRAWHLHGEGAHQDRAWQEHGAEVHQDRAWQSHGECHRDRALASMMDGELHRGQRHGQGLLDGRAGGQDQIGEGTRQFQNHGFGDSQGGGNRVDLPPLPTSLTPMDLGDWLTLIGPILRDITPQSAVWWDLTVKQARRFYEEWRTSSPVQRVRINPVLPDELLKPVFARTEQRGVGLLLEAVSEDLRRILISNRDMNSTSLVWRLLFQPGGSGEKGQLLEDLTVLKSSNTAESVAVALRHWRRCFKRAQEIGASLPDGTLLLKGLEVTTKVLAGLDSQTAFRIAQSRSELAVDTALNASVLWQFSQVLLAEAETLQLTATTTSSKSTTNPLTPQAKLLQGAGLNPKTPAASGACKFWGTTDGCRNGKQCKYPHPDLADKKDRCWVCSATTHGRNECPVAANSASSKPDGGSGACGGQGGKGGSKGKTKAESGSGQTEPAVKATRSGGTTGGGGTVQSGDGQNESQTGGTNGSTTTTTTENPPTSTVKAEEILPATGETSLMNEVTSLLRSLRAEASVKVCGIRRLQSTDQVSVLLDGGATHCLRTCESDRVAKFL